MKYIFCMNVARMLSNIIFSTLKCPCTSCLIEKEFLIAMTMYQLRKEDNPQSLCQ